MAAEHDDPIAQATSDFSTFYLLSEQVVGLVDEFAINEQAENPLLACFFPEMADHREKLIARYGNLDGPVYFVHPPGGKPFIWPNNRWECAIKRARELYPKWCVSQEKCLRAITTLAPHLDARVSSGGAQWSHAARRDVIELRALIPPDNLPVTTRYGPPFKPGDSLLLQADTHKLLTGEQGRALLERIRVRVLDIQAADIGPAKQPEGDEPAGGDDAPKDLQPTTCWESIRDCLLAMRERSEPYTSSRKLARELGCSESTIRKAINQSETLKGWKARSSGAKTAPNAKDLDAVVIDDARQIKESPPDDFLPDDDVDTVMARLIEQAKPDERARLNALDDTGRREIVKVYHAQRLDDEPSPLEPDKPGGRPREVKQHKRV